MSCSIRTKVACEVFAKIKFELFKKKFDLENTIANSWVRSCPYTKFQVFKNGTGSKILFNITNTIDSINKTIDWICEKMEVCVDSFTMKVKAYKLIINTDPLYQCNYQDLWPGSIESKDVTMGPKTVSIQVHGKSTSFVYRPIDGRVMSNEELQRLLTETIEHVKKNGIGC